MTRPFGKSPARTKDKRTPTALEPLSLIDVSSEDDSLVPFGNAPGSTQNTNLSSPVDRGSLSATNSGNALASIQEEELDCDQLNAPEHEPHSPVATREPVSKKKKKKSGFNLRKSLAWNNAFFTEEGVLDPEELSLVNRTFKKIPDLSKPNSHKKSMLSAKFLKPPAVPKLDFSPAISQRSVRNGDSLLKHTLPTGAISLQRSPNGSAGSSITGSASKWTAQRDHIAKGPPSKPPTGIHQSSRMQMDTVKQVKPTSTFHAEATSRPLFPKKVVDSNFKRTAPNLSERTMNPKLQPVQLKETHSFSSTISSVSKRMKDKLGMVLSGRSSGLQTGNVPVKSSSLGAGPADSAKVTRCYSQSSFERFGRSPVVTVVDPGPNNGANYQEPASTQNRSHHQLEKLANKFNLDMSPRNWFSANRGSTLQGPVNAEANIHSKVNLGPTSDASSPQICKVSSCDQPVHEYVPTKVDFTLKSSCPVGGSEAPLYKGKPSGLRMPSPKLGFFDTARATTAPQLSVLRERTNGFPYDGAALQSGRSTMASKISTGVGSYQYSSGKPPIGSVKPSQTEVGPQTKEAGVLTAVPSTQHFRGSENVPKSHLCVTQGLPKYASVTSNNKADSTGNNRGHVLPGKKALPGVLQSGRKIVSNLTSSLAGQETASDCKQLKEVLLPQSPSVAEGEAVERVADKDSNENCGVEIIDEEWPQEKSGAVQHSPPDKESPKHGPWSPVRRHGQQLGPFDCTKCTNTGILL